MIAESPGFSCGECVKDLIGVEHNKAMRKVEELAKEEGFGTLAKTATVYNDRGQTIPTYPFGGVTEILALASIHLLRLGGLASPDLSCFKLNSFNIQ